MRLLAGMVALLAAGLPPLWADQVKPPASPVAAPASPPGLVVERVTIDELKKMMEADKALVVDVRSAEAYKSGHIPGAILAPLSELEKQLPELLKSAKKPIVTYCT